MATAEKLKCNEVPRTLFIGLGGCGSGIVQGVASLCRGSEADNISFVCLDTNVNDLSEVEKGGKRIASIQMSGTQTVGSYLDYDEDALKNWFPKNAVMYDKTVSEGAGQVRAISRLAFNSAVKVGKIRALQDAIDELFRKDGKEFKQAMRVVIVSSASGGTGSGIILPLSMYVRSYIMNKYPNTGVVVRALLMLPEVFDNVIRSEVERESQRRNAYATVKEINAFMMKGSGFFDVDADLKRYAGIHIDFTEQGTDNLHALSLLPFDFCFLFDGQNAEDSTLVSLDQYKRQAALALYEQNIGPMQKAAFSVEDNIIKELSNRNNFGRNRFGGIGAGMLRYPYDDVAQYAAYQWAIERIGGEGDAAKWSKYDNRFAVKRDEARKNGLSISEQPRLQDVYVSLIDEGDDGFSRDLRSMYLQEAEDAVMEYMQSLDSVMADCMTSNSAIRGVMAMAEILSRTISYGSDDNTRGNASQNLGRLRAFEVVTQNNIEKTARNRVEAIFQNESKTINAAREGKTHTLEHLLTHAINGVVHPNAMRYLLYMLQTRFEEGIANKDSVVKSSRDGLLNFSSQADRPDLFDVGYTKKTDENTIDAFCSAEREPKLFQPSMDGYYDKLNELFPKYYSTIKEYGVSLAQRTAYEFGLNFVKELSAQLEEFYATFTDKVKLLTLRQEDLVSSLVFHKGDSIVNICCSEPILKELAQTSDAYSGGLMLPSELNAQLFDAVKSNVIFAREAAVEAVVMDDRRISLFDDILLSYFRKAVDEKCGELLDMNIIEAIAMQYRLEKRITDRENIKPGEKQFDKVEPNEVERYIKKMIRKGERLSAPGIQRMLNCEPREIVCRTYNVDLLDMRQYRIKDLVDHDTPSDTVSKYELRFFNALYNVTPDKLNKFASPHVSETGERPAGLYHMAYTEYARDIGPDSTKTAKISTHIDKRWDSLSVMPEIDLGFQQEKIIRIHQAMIYGLVHGAIQYKRISTAPGAKTVYKYVNSQERGIELIVSNGTPCDEFYEILDALYISSSIVEDIGVIAQDKRERDGAKHSSYEDTVFAHDVEAFSINRLHEDRASLFEIPMAYYNSLPNNRRFISELTAMVDAIIKTLKDEVQKWENSDDKKFILCNLLGKEFELLMKNYNQYETVHMGTPASENPVLDIIYRKVKHVYETTPEPTNYREMIEEMRTKIQTSELVR